MLTASHAFDAEHWRRARLMVALRTMELDLWPQLTAPGFREELYRRAGLPLPEGGASC